jgi:hypothetical protein
MNDFRDRLKALPSAAMFGEAASVLVAANAALAQAQENQLEAAEAVRLAAKQALTSLCTDQSVPMLERAAWSAAFHAHGDGRVPSMGVFADVAAKYHNRLAATHELLRTEPNVPIVWFRTPHPEDTSRTMRYGYRIGDGSGLTITEKHTPRPFNVYHHSVTAGERPSVANSAVASGGRRPVIFNLSSGVLVDAQVEPETAVAQLVPAARPSECLIIGAAAAGQFFDIVRREGGERAVLLFGHAVLSGYKPPQ